MAKSLLIQNTAFENKFHFDMRKWQKRQNGGQFYQTFSKKQQLYLAKNRRMKKILRKQRNRKLLSGSWQKYHVNRQFHLLLDKGTWKTQKRLAGFKGLNPMETGKVSSIDVCVSLILFDCRPLISNLAASE
jgi:hypothetical protein